MNVPYHIVYYNLRRGDPNGYFIKIDALRCIREILGVDNIEQLLKTEEKLRPSVINKLKGMWGVSKKLAKAMNVSHRIVYNNLKKGDPNGYFIKIDALRCIREILGVDNIEQLLKTEEIPSFEDICTDAKIEMIPPKPRHSKEPIEPEQFSDTMGEIVKVEEISQESLGQRLFTFAPGNQTIRVETINNEPWFVAKDVCDVLGIEKYRDAIARLDDDEKGRLLLMDTPGGKQQLSAINESGLYSLIFQSRKPEAKIFRKWVTAEVLPALRKTGEYRTKRRRNHCKLVPANSDISQLLQLIVDNLQKNDKKTVAAQLGVSPVSVSNILSGKTRSNTILQALYEKALENKQNGFINTYSNEFVIMAIEKLQ
jgi:prophage antirepressor-like protein